VADAYTPLGFTKPEIGGSTSTWGNKWNTNLDSIDTEIRDLQAGVAANGSLAATKYNIAGGTITGSVTINSANPSLNLRKTADSQNTGLFGRSSTGALRWALYPGNGTTESGGNAGTNFAIARYDDAGTQLSIPVTIARSTGIVSMHNGVSIAAGATVANGLTVSSGGASVTGSLAVAGSGSVAGDLQVYRPNAPTTGVVYLNQANDKYLWWNGTKFLVNGTFNCGVLEAASASINGAAYAAGNITTPGSVTGAAMYSNEYRFATDTGSGISYGGGNTVNIVTSGGVARLVVTATTVTTAGTMQAANFVISSDARLKTDITTITDAVDTVNKLRGVSFIKNGRKSYGVIAQEIETVLPSLVGEDSAGMKHVALMDVVGILIEAVKELSARVDDLELHA